VRFDDVKVLVWTRIGSWRPRAEIVMQVAKDCDVPLIAVEADIVYYHDHRGAIDAVLAENDTSYRWYGPIEPETPLSSPAKVIRVHHEE
jgi:hypothetical protein